MADTGFSWSAWAFVQKGAVDWDDDALADSATETSDAIELTGKAACEISIEAAEDNTGAISGNLKVFILGETGNGYEETAVGSPYAFEFTPVQNDTVPVRFSVDPGAYGAIKIAIQNNSGQEVALDVHIRTATIPAAS